METWATANSVGDFIFICDIPAGPQKAATIRNLRQTVLTHIPHARIDIETIDTGEDCVTITVKDNDPDQVMMADVVPWWLAEPI